MKFRQRIEYLLPAVLLGIILVFGGSAKAGSAFQEPALCGQCHTDNMAEWATSMHSKAFTSTIFQAAAARLGIEQAGDPNVSNASIRSGCYGCHSPAKALTQASSISATDPGSGVTCDFCHTVKGYSRLFNAGYISNVGEIKYGPFADSKSPAHKAAKLPLVTSSEFCGMCHNVKFGMHKLPFLDTYTEWKAGPYAKQNIKCQHCMMGESKNKRAATSGPVRATVYGHAFAGGNVFQGNTAVATKRLRNAATLTLTTDSDMARPGDELGLTIKVKNSGAGHKLPTGITFVREMRLEVTAEDAHGAITKVFTERYGTVLQDDKGNHNRAVAFWKAVKIYSDNRIKPLETRVYDKTFKIPATAKTGYKINAVLTYRSVNPDSVKPYGLPETKPVTMAVAQKIVTVSNNAPGRYSILWLWLLGGLAAIAAISTTVYLVIRRKPEA